MAKKQLGVAPSGTTDAATKSYVDSATINTNTGLLQPVQTTTVGNETFTIASGSVTQIAGTTINGYTPAVGDRILIMNAPASTGTGSGFGFSTQPTNGIYTVTGNTTNVSVSRSADLSGSVKPAGLGVYIENGGWNGGSVFTVTTPANLSAFTYGTGNIAWQLTGGSSPNFPTLYTTNLNVWNGSNWSTTVGSGTGTQTLTLPSPASDVLVSRTSTDTLTNKSISYNQITGLTGGNTSTQSQTVVSATAYYVTGSAIAVPTNVATTSRFRWTVAMAKTAAGTGIFEIIIYRGTAGSTADTADVAQTLGTQTAVVDNMTVDVEVAVTTTGASGAYYWSIVPTAKAASATGFGVAVGPTGQFSGTKSTVAMNTASLKFGLGFRATTGTPTITVPMVRANGYV